MPSSPDELFDVVDAEDCVTGRATRAEVHAQGLLHRAVHIWVVRPDGDLVLQMRSPTKDQYPSTWTSSASGHLDAGESYDAAAARELTEELGVSLPLVRLGKLAASPATSMEHTVLYRVDADVPLTPDPEEVAFLEERPVTEWLVLLDAAPATFSPAISELLRNFGPQIN